MAHRPFTPAQQRQNEAFLAALRRTGNVRLACRELGVHRGTYTKRRGKCAAFATEWDEALAAAHAAFQLAGGVRMPAANSPLPSSREGSGVGHAGKARSSRAKSRGANDDPEPAPFDFAQDERSLQSLRTRGGEPTIVRQANGRLQLRLAPPGRMTEAAASLFFETVSETANIRMAAAAAGFAHTSLLARARLHPGFARELGIRVQIGRDRVLWSLSDPDRGNGAEWPSALPPIPGMSVEQAIFQLHFHRPGGTFQRAGWRPRPFPVPFAQHAPRIVAKLNAMQRAHWHRETGKWKFPEEE